MPRTFGSSARCCAHPASTTIAAATAAKMFLLERILDIGSDVRPAVNDIRPVDHEDQMLLVGDVGHRAARLIYQRLERPVLLVGERLLIILKDLLLLLLVFLGSLHLLQRAPARVAGKLQAAVVGGFGFRT